MAVDEVVRCLYQVLKTYKQRDLLSDHDQHYTQRLEGWGNCSECLYDKDNNPRCSGFYPIKLKEFYRDG